MQNTLLRKIKETLNRYSIIQGYQSVHTGSTSDCESISPALVQMKVSTGAMERQSKTTPKKGTVLHVVATDDCSLLILPD